MKIITTCKYCGHKETFYVYDKNSVVDNKCEVCGDKNKKVDSAEKQDVFGYNKNGD